MLNLFIGSAPSKYAALAIFAAVIIVSLTMLFGKEPVPLGQKLAVVLLIFLISLPGILLTLFQMTCIVTGAGFISKDSPLGKRWWCSLYAWIISVLIIVYSVFIIVAAITTLATGEKVMNDIAIADAEAFENKLKQATQQAAEHFATQKAEVADASVASPTQPAVAPAADVAPMMEDKKKEVLKDTFVVAGGASQPAPVDPFEKPEGFSSCGAPF
jgi:hypothetical protein